MIRQSWGQGEARVTHGCLVLGLMNRAKRGETAISRDHKGNPQMWEMARIGGLRRNEC